MGGMGWDLAKLVVWLAPFVAWKVRDDRRLRRRLAADPRPDRLKPRWWTLRFEGRAFYPPLPVFAFALAWSTLFLFVIP